MGGYGAVIFAGALWAKSCLAISAQYSADPDVVPEEERWKAYRERIVRFTRPPLEDTLEPGCTYFVLHGGGKVERPHWSRYPVCPNLHHYIIGKVGHGVGKRLKSAGLINRVTECATGVRPVALRRALAGELEFRRRSSPEVV